MAWLTSYKCQAITPHELSYAALRYATSARFLLKTCARIEVPQMLSKLNRQQLNETPTASFLRLTARLLLHNGHRLLTTRSFSEPLRVKISIYYGCLVLTADRPFSEKKP